MAEASGIRHGDPVSVEEPIPRGRGGGGRDPSAIGARGGRGGGYGGGGERSIAARSVVNSIAFRGFAQDGEKSVAHRDVEFTSEDTELPEGSRLTLAGLDTNFPMAFDNDRFFGPEGYKDLLRQAFEAMAKLSQRNQSWGAPAAEMGFFGLLWRWFVKVFMSWTNDAVNRLRYTRGVQDNLPFQTGYESFALGGVVRAYDVDERKHDRFNINLAFQNRNTSRVLVQNLTRWDWVWHLGTSVTWSRLFDFIGLFPFIGFTRFPATENFPASKNHALAGIFRLIFEGSWFTRFFTSKQQGIVTFDRHTAAQNLAAESIGFEGANRNQYGTFFGREKTNDFRFEHRLPTDESIVRTFLTSPAGTMVNNGVEHVLRCLAKHWRNMLYQENGNFAHQRMEQLNPFETLRFHMPVVLHVLANLRGRNAWDTKVLGPFIKRLQYLNPDKIKKKRGKGDVEDADEDQSEIYAPCQAAQGLVREMQEKIVPNVCGGVPSRMEPFDLWLHAISDSLDELSREAEAVKDFVASVDTGINLGYQLLKLVDWHVPSESTMKAAIVDFILGKPTNYPEIPSEVINSALHKLASKDERTLKELIKKGLGKVEAAKLLLGRSYSLLERELRRKALDDRIIELAKGLETSPDNLERNKWYWVETEIGLRANVFKGRYGSRVRFTDVETNLEDMYSVDTVSIREYIPIAEAISRAQKAFMIIEIDHGKKFQYNAFMEFGSTDRTTSLRSRLRRLIVLAQVHCSALDQARLNVLGEIKSSVELMRKSAKFAASRLVAECKPQNVTVLGGGPTGLLSAIHCIQNVILTGGEVKLYEGRDAFAQEAASFERAQIVRLDSRQISMLRFHLGTGYEDVYIPVQGETDAHMGNTLPNQGFVEVTIKRLESMILDEVINLRSKELMHFYADSKIKADVVAGIFEKQGDALKIGDDVFDGDELMKVVDFTHLSAATPQDLVAGQDYDIVLQREKKVRKFRLVQKDADYDWYQFESHEAGVRDVTGSYNNLPPVYLAGKGRTTPSAIIMEDIDGARKELSFDSVEKKLFRMDFSRTHVVVALGKPAGSPTHFYITTDEPYSVCCIEGIKISMGMHNFGEKRWGKGLIDDIRSHSDQNTRIIGDFTKTVALMPIIGRMHRKLDTDPIWKYHFEHLAESLKDKVQPLHKILLAEMGKLCQTKFERERLQTRFFELGNNYYLGMELPREFDLWKKNTVELGAPSKAATAPDAAKKTRSRLQGTLMNHLDRLWYEACLEIIAEGDVYNPGGRSKIPQLYTIDSPFEQKLGDLKERESFRLFTKKYRVVSHDGEGLTKIQNEFSTGSISIPTKSYVLDLATNGKKSVGELSHGDLFEPIDTFEVVAKRGSSSIVRNNSGGYTVLMKNDVPVGRVSDLSRAPDGYSESKVSLAAFPVAHVVSHRTLRVNRVQGRGGEDGFITAHVGDAQSSPHFMRYSGLTGACINCMSINNLVAQALQGVPFEDRIQRYAFETNWSNGEVVQRGTGANYGEDGFLFPGFPYRKGIDYLYDRALENLEIGADTEKFMSRDWKIKFAAALVPRGLETDDLFYESLIRQLEKVLRSKFEDEVKLATGNSKLPAALQNSVTAEMDSLVKQWTNPGASAAKSTVGGADGAAIQKTSLVIRSVILALKQTIDYAVELRFGDLRISSELFNQPKPVDSVVDDFAVEAQNFANALVQSSAFTAATVALPIASSQGAGIASGVLGVWNIGVSFGTMTNVARYRNRNEEARVRFFDSKMLFVLKDVFSMMTQDQRDHVPLKDNPYVEGLEKSAKTFLYHCEYYNMTEDKINLFKGAYERYKGSNRNQASTIEFMRQVVQEFVADTFQVNSYLQRDLVNIYKELEENLALSKQGKASGTTGADELFRMLVQFRPQLEASLERGDIKYGFLKDHKWYQTALPVSLKFLFGWMLCNQTISSKTWAVLKKAESLEKNGVSNPSAIKRPIHDLRELYHATKESEVGSMMFLSGFIVFCFSIFFSLFRLIQAAGADDQWVQDVLNAASWAAIGTTLGSSIAIFHFVRKLRHLFSLNAGLRSMRSDPRIRRVRLITVTQELLVFIRLLAVCAAAVSLPWSVAVQTFGSDISLDEMLPVYIAAGSVGAAAVATVFFFFVEFAIRYNLDPQLGIAVCEPFSKRIEHVKQSFTKSADGIETPQKMEKVAWEYATRQFLHEYRFDTVFAADRFGTIMQHLQSGNKKLE